MHHKRKKHATVVLDFLKAIRCRYPEAKRIYVVMDNLSTHKTPTILQWCRHNQVSPRIHRHQRLMDESARMSSHGSPLLRHQE